MGWGGGATPSSPGENNEAAGLGGEVEGVGGGMELHQSL